MLHCNAFVYSSSTGYQLLFSYPKFYAHNLPDDFFDENRNVSNAVEGSHVKAAPWKHLSTLTSSAGQQFLSFAKYSDYGQGQAIVLLWLLLKYRCQFSVLVDNKINTLCLFKFEFLPCM